MWLLTLLPDSLLAWAVNIVLIAGIIGVVASVFFDYVVRWLPAIAPYHLIIKVVSIIVLVCGVYFKGGQAVEMVWRERVTELEAKVAIAEEKSNKINKEIKTVYVDRIKVIKEKQIVVEKQIVEVAAKIDAKCEVSPETVDILNEAAKGVNK
jgi:hypothetical protein